MKKEDAISRLFEYVKTELDNSGWWIFNKKHLRLFITRILEPHEKSANLPLPDFMKIDYLTIDVSGINTGKYTTPWSEIYASGVKTERISKPAPGDDYNYVYFDYLLLCMENGKILEFPLSDIRQFKGLFGHFIELYKAESRKLNQPGGS